MDESFVSPSKCFIVGCARNCGEHIPKVFENIRKLGTLFQDTKIYIAYDHSTDDTLSRLHAENATLPNMEIIVNIMPLSPIRTERICNARNTLLQTVKAQYKPGWDFFIMIDLDDVCAYPIKLENIRRYLGRTDWDCLSWNRPFYYDIWALSYPPYVVSCWNWGADSTCLNVIEHMRSDIQNRLNGCGETDLYPCNSAFNGIAIYRIVKFHDCVYDWKTMQFESLPQQDLVASIQTFRSYPMYRPLYDDCEHREFHRQAIAKHGAQIRISPFCAFRYPE